MKVLVEGLEEPSEAGSVCTLRDHVAQLALAAASKRCLREVGLDQRRGTSCVLQGIGLWNRRLPPRKQGNSKERKPKRTKFTLTGFTSAAAAKSHQSCPALCSHQALPSSGFSRQEHPLPLSKLFFSFNSQQQNQETAFPDALHLFLFKFKSSGKAGQVRCNTNWSPVT